jgi:hypothetical protein
MKTTDKTNGADGANVIDASAALKKRSRLGRSLAPPAGTPRPGLKDGDLEVLDRYIAARRRQALAEAQADGLKPAVLAIVKVHLQVARKGAVVKLKNCYEWKYSAVIAEMAKDLSDAKETARENGSALASVGTTVAFEDVRAKERAKRERMRAS